MTPNPWRDIATRLACALEAVLDTEPGPDGWWQVDDRAVTEAGHALDERLALIHNEETTPP